MNPKQIARAILRLYNHTPACWTQGTPFRDMDGHPCRHPTATSFSLDGAVTLVLADVVQHVQYPRGVAEHAAAFRRAFCAFLSDSGIMPHGLDLTCLEEFNDTAKSFTDIEAALVAFISMPV